MEANRFLRGNGSMSFMVWFGLDPSGSGLSLFIGHSVKLKIKISSVALKDVEVCLFFASQAPNGGHER